jgi:hypothetical protein
VKSYFVSYSEPLDEDIDKVEMIKEFEPGAIASRDRKSMVFTACEPG